MHRGRRIVWLLDLHESPVTAKEHLARVEGLLAHDEVAFEVGREVPPGGHAHVVGLAFVDERRGGKRSAAGPLADRPRVSRGGERSGAEIGGHEQAVGIAPRHAALGLRQRETARHEGLLFQVELPHHVGISATAGERHEAEPILRLEHGGAMPDPVFPLLHRERIEVEHGLPGRLRLAVFVERRPPPQPLGVCGIPPDVVEAVADLRDHRNPLLRIEDAADPCLEGLEAVRAGQRRHACGVATANPFELLLARDVLQPKMRIGRLVREGGCRHGHKDAPQKEGTDKARGSV